MLEDLLFRLVTWEGGGGGQMQVNKTILRIFESF